MSCDATVAAQLALRRDSLRLRDRDDVYFESGEVDLQRINVSASDTSSIYFHFQSQLHLAHGIDGDGLIYTQETMVRIRC